MISRSFTGSEVWKGLVWKVLAWDLLYLWSDSGWGLVRLLPSVGSHGLSRGLSTLLLGASLQSGGLMAVRLLTRRVTAPVESVLAHKLYYLVQLC